MIELIRNCTHGSEVAVYLVKGGERLIRKCSYTTEGIGDLHREARGWEWYASIRYQHLQRKPYKISVNKGYARLELQWIEGTKGELRKGLLGNQDLIYQAIQHYCSIWSDCEGQQVPLHGDFSIDNVLHNADGLHILDWEHFYPNVTFWGFDAVYLISEALWFGMTHGRPLRQELPIAVTALKLLAATGKLPESVINNPLEKTKSFMTSNHHIWGPQLAKFPLTNFCDDQIMHLDKQIGELL